MMIQPEVYCERTPLSDKDCFVIFERRKTNFTFPVHVHPEYEINFVSGAPGARRVIGNSLETIGDKDLVFIANSQLKHPWMDGECKSQNITYHKCVRDLSDYGYIRYKPSFNKKSGSRIYFLDTRRSEK